MAPHTEDKGGTFSSLATVASQASSDRSRLTTTSWWKVNNSTHNSYIDIIHLQVESCAPELEDSKNTDELRAPGRDEGYAWIVLGCCMFLQIIPAVPQITAGIFYSEFLQEFHRGGKLTACIGALNGAIVYMISPVIAVFVDLTSSRTSCMTGCVGTALSLVISALTTNFEVVFILFGILAPIFMCMVYIPACVFVSQYFVRRRVLVLCLVTASVPVGTLTLPPLTIWLIETLEWRYTMIVLAGFCMQGVVCGALLRPPPPLPDHMDDEPHKLTRQNILNSLSEYSLFASSEFHHVTTTHHEPKTEDTIGANSFMTALHNAPVIDFGSQDVYRPTYDQHLEGIPETQPSMDSLSESSIDAVSCANEKHDFSSLVQDVEPQIEESGQLTENITTTQDDEGSFHDSVSESGDDIEKDLPSRCLSLSRRLCVKALIALFISSFTHGWGASVFFVLGPDYWTSVSGTGNTEIAAIFVVIGVAGFISRMACGVIGHWIPYNKIAVVLVGHFIMALSLLLFTIFADYKLYCFLAAVYAIGYGLVSSLTGPLIIKIVGDRDVGLEFSVVTLVYGVGCVTAAPSVAYLVELTGNYSMGFQMTAAILMCGGSALLPILILDMCTTEASIT